MDKYAYLGWNDYGVDYLKENCNKPKKLTFTAWFGYNLNANEGR
jgi:hypothetical protein